MDKERTNDVDDDQEVGGLFHVSQRKKISVNDQEDYTFMDRREPDTSEKSRDWNLDEVTRAPLGVSRRMDRDVFTLRYAI